MAVKMGRESTYTGALIKVRELVDIITLIAREETPLLDRIGLGSYTNGPVHNVKFEWMEDSLIPFTGQLAEALDATETEIDVDHAEYRQLGQIILVESELMWIMAINTNASTLTVLRGYAGTTAAAHNDDTTFKVVGVAKVEGSSPGVARQTTTVQPWNTVQIFSDTVSITGTEDAMKEYGVDNLLDYRMDKRMREQKLIMEQALIHGQRYLPVSNAEARVSGGLDFFISDLDDFGAALLYTDVRTALKTAYDRVGAAYKPTTLFLNSTNAQALSDEFIYRGHAAEAALTVHPVRTERGETVGGGKITMLTCDVGDIEIVVDHLLGAAECWLLNPEFIMSTWLAGREMGEFEANIEGHDFIRHRMLGELGWVVKNDDCHVKLYT